jgi:hypothetical protein
MMKPSRDLVSLRLTSNQMSVIWPGLDLLVKGYISKREKKIAIHEYPFRLYPPPSGFNRGVFHQELMEEILLFWQRLFPRSSSGGRMQMTTIEIRIAIFAVRVNLDLWRRQKHDARKLTARAKCLVGVDGESLIALTRRSRRTIATLERHLKRSNRVAIAVRTNEEYSALTRAWRKHLRWMRLYLAYFKPLPPVRGGRKTRHQAIIDTLVDMAAQGLRDKGVHLPNEIELRWLMRLFARSSRRGCRAGYTIPFMMSHKTTFNAKLHLANFVLDRMDLKPLS